MTLRRFFNNSIGVWESHRNYYYSNNNSIEAAITTFTWQSVEDSEVYSVQWENSISPGKRQMTFKLVDDFTIERDAGYFTKLPTTTKVESCSDKTLRTITEYNDVSYDERIEFITDTLRIRRTIGTKISTKEVILVGNYIEKRIS